MPSGSTTPRKPQPPADPPVAPTARGRVQRIYPERSFGFIKCFEGPLDDIGADFFFHASGLLDCDIQHLQEGIAVTFTPTYVPKGKRAERIRTKDDEGE